MNVIEIRYSELDDLPALTDIYNEQVLNGVATFDTEAKSLDERRLWFEVHQNPRYPLLTALVDGEIAGWASLSPFHTKPAYQTTTEFSLYIHKEHRAKGVGTALLRELFKLARELGYHAVIGVITGSNAHSLAITAKFGFVQVGYYPEIGKKFGKWLDVVVMQLML